MRKFTLEQLQNFRLTDVSGRPDLCRIRLATPAEIEALAGPVVDGIDRGVVTQWRMVAIEITGKPVMIVLIGVREHLYYGTSPIVRFDEAATKVRTESGSIYQLAEAGRGEPPAGHAAHMCVLLNAWGWGAVLDLPEVWY